MAAKDSQIVSETPRQWAHQQLDFLLDYADREQLWGDIEFKPIIQAGRLVKVDLKPNLGKKFEATSN